MMHAHGGVVQRAAGAVASSSKGSRHSWCSRCSSRRVVSHSNSTRRKGNASRHYEGRRPPGSGHPDMMWVAFRSARGRRGDRRGGSGHSCVCIGGGSPGVQIVGGQRKCREHSAVEAQLTVVGCSGKCCRHPSIHKLAHGQQIVPKVRLPAPYGSRPRSWYRCSGWPAAAARSRHHPS